MANARFWVTWGSTDVKVTLKPGEVLEHLTGGDTEEGYHIDSYRWEHTGDEVTYEHDSDASDCDGPIQHHWVGSCPLDRLRDKECGPCEANFPPWRNRRAWQRDVFAERMGY